MKKTLALLAVFAISIPFMAMAQSTPQTTNQGEQMSVTAYSLHVRSQPWIGQNTLGYLRRGDSVTVFDRTNGWCRIDYWGNTNAYVSCAYLRGGQTQPEAWGGPTTTGTNSVTAYSLNVRSQPGIGQNIIGNLRRGDTVSILERRGNWCRIDYWGNTNAYVSCAYLRGDQTQPEAWGGPVTTGTNSVTAYSLHVRSQPGIGQNIIGNLRRGDTVSILERRGNWCRIDYRGNTNAYVSCNYLR